MEDIRKKLIEPFKENEIEWKPQSVGVSNGKHWAMVLAYVSARAIQNRLDDVFGFDGWQTEYKVSGENMICRLSVKTNEWIYKEDGAPETNVEAFKGGLSSAFKRVAASGYGIGRYLYYLDTSFAECTTIKPENNTNWNKCYDKNTKTNFWWKTPKLPSWALPKENK